MKARTVFSTVAALGVMVLCVCRPAMAAISAPDAFNSLLSNANVTGPGYYTSATRGVFVGGSTNLYVPNDTVQLISISPPTESAGCGGISLYFGGFSFINGPQLQQLVTEVMQNALGYALQLGIRVLCPMCSDILGELQKMAQTAASSSKSSCQIASNLVQSVASHAGLSASSSGSSGSCADLASSQGKSTDYIDAMTSVCQGVNTASAWINSNINSLFASDPDQGSQEAAKYDSQLGNPLWAQLTLAGYSDTDVKEIFISMVGFTAVAQNPGQTKPSSHFYPGWNSVGIDNGKILLDIILFGADPAHTKQALIAAKLPVTVGLQTEIDNAEKLNYGSLNFDLCRGINGSTLVIPPAQTPAKGGAGNVPFLRMCDTIAHGTHTVASVAASGANPLITSNGLIAYVATTLGQAVKNIAAGQPIPAAAIELMQITPLPVYRMINIAAVYPSVAKQLVTNYSSFIGYIVAQQVVESWIDAPTQQVQGIAVSDLGGTMQKQLETVLDSLMVSVLSKQKDISQALTLQDGILASIKQVNDVMYQSLAGTGIQGNLMFTQGLAAGMTEGH